jgi:butyryl-CoA dehydrogenase
MKACPAAELVFEDCFVPAECAVGRTGKAVEFTELVLGASRGPVGAIATGVARGAFERAVDIARRKKIGGRRLIDRQWVQLKLADMARRIHISRQAYLDACMSFDFQGVPKLMGSFSSKLLLDWTPAFLRKTAAGTRALKSESMFNRIEEVFRENLDRDDLRHIQQYSSMAKITGSDTAVEVAYEALEIAGFESTLHRLELEKIYRDAKLTQIYEGTNQLNRHNVFINCFPGEAACE